MNTKELINLLWAVVFILGMILAAFYVHNKSKIEKLKLIHPKIGEALDFAGQLAVKATNYQSTQDKAGHQKLSDASDEVYQQVTKAFPGVHITQDTVRNLVQYAYDFAGRDQTQSGKDTKVNSINEVTKSVIATKPEVLPQIKSPIDTKGIKDKSKKEEMILDDLHV